MTTDKLLFLDEKNPINRAAAELRKTLRCAQESTLESEFQSLGTLLEKAARRAQICVEVPLSDYEQPVATIRNFSFSSLEDHLRTALTSGDVSAHIGRDQARLWARETKLVEAFDDPDAAIGKIEDKVKKVVASFPREAAHIEKGRNPGDVIDPFILAASQYLLCSGDFARSISAAVSHKALMIIEGLLGHLHEDAIAMMRGNVRVPEPRGEDQETLDPATNPFPGADVVSPPKRNGDCFRFHQIKSKTGSAKGGDGRRLGEQLSRLADLYGGETYYHALIGNTLRGHRSKAGVERAAPEVIVLVGASSFEVLTGSRHGAELLLKLYQTAFENVAEEEGYDVDEIAKQIAAEFTSRSEASGEGYLETILSDVTDAPPELLDNRLFNKST